MEILEQKTITLEKSEIDLLLTAIMEAKMYTMENPERSQKPQYGNSHLVQLNKLRIKLQEV